MSNEILAMLLKIISSNASLQQLADLGYTYSQISIFFDETILLEYVENINGVLSLTNKGKDFLLQYFTSNKIRNSQQWIMPQIAYKRKKLDKYDIILPKKI